MKLSNLKQRLIEKNSNLPENQRRISSLRKEFRNKKEHGLNELKNESIAERQVEWIPTFETRQVGEYKKNVELSNLHSQTSISLPEQKSNDIVVGDTYSVDKIKIIGITGSKGKSTTAYIVHEYLKLLGYKSVLHSSIQIDSPAGYTNKNEACEIPLYNENGLLDIIEEAEAIDADYIVLEVNESTIKKGLVNDIPFSVRALTNINPLHNVEQYSKEEYVRLKQSFFENIPANEECTCVFGLVDVFTRDDFNQLLRLNNHPKVTYGTKYICELRNADYSNIDCLLYGMSNSINGLGMEIRVKENSFDFKTNVILPHNAINFTCAIAIIEALGIFNAASFNKCVENMTIPGREEVIRVQNRTIVIGLFLEPALENFKKYKEMNEANQVKVILGAIGTGFSSWSKEFSTELFISKRSSARRFAVNYAKEYADYIYITSNDNAAENPVSIAEELQGYINNQVPSCIVVDREEAIRKAIVESQRGDIIYISGRGNRRIFCDSANTVKLIQDKEVVYKVISELGW